MKIGSPICMFCGHPFSNAMIELGKRLALYLAYEFKGEQLSMTTEKFGEFIDEHKDELEAIVSTVALRKAALSVVPLLCERCRQLTACLYEVHKATNGHISSETLTTGRPVPFDEQNRLLIKIQDALVKHNVRLSALRSQPRLLDELLDSESSVNTSSSSKNGLSERK